MKGFGIAVMVMVAMAMLMTVKPGQALTCQQVDAALVPCIPYLTSGGNPVGACCAGVKNIKNMASTTADRRFACNCVKQAASRYPTLKEDAASALPSKCGVQISFPISKNINCNSIS